MPDGVDLERPNAARVYDYLLGGTANWAIDREFGDQLIEKLPMARILARVNRDFLGRAVRYCARNGISQFLDIGSGVPTVGNVHEVADEVDPASRCVYVDNERVAVAHAQLVLEREGDPARHAALNGDLLEVDELWPAVRETGVLDLDRPIALLMVAVLHFVSPETRVAEVVARYRDLLPSGSHLVISHATENGLTGPELARTRQLTGMYAGSSNPVFPRPRTEIVEFFGDFELLEPGLVWLPQWRLDVDESIASRRIADRPELSRVVGGVARKP